VAKRSRRARVALVSAGAALLLVSIWLLYPGLLASFETRFSDAGDSLKTPVALTAPDTTAQAPTSSSPNSRVSSSKNTELPAPNLSPPTDPLLDLDIAPADAFERLRRCRAEHFAAAESARQQEIKWLAPESAALESERFEAAKAWAEQRCKDWQMTWNDPRRAALSKAFIERGQRSLNVKDQLAAAIQQLETDAQPKNQDETRDLLDRALRSGDPNLLESVGRMLSMLGIEDMGIYAGSRYSFQAFMLAGCAMGAPCGADSAILRQNCFVLGRCGYLDYPAFALDSSVAPEDVAVVMRVRDQIVQRIRSGQTAGMLQPPASVTPTPRGG